VSAQYKMSRRPDSLSKRNSALCRAIIFFDGDSIKANSAHTLPGITKRLIERDVIVSETQVKTTVYIAENTISTDGARYRTRGVWYSDEELRDLRLAGCLVVACEIKKDDTDRQIGASMEDFVMYENPKHNVVVLVSSSQHHFDIVRALRTRGFQVWIVTDCRFDSEQYGRTVAAASPGCCIALHDILKPCRECLGISHGQHQCAIYAGSAVQGGSLCPLCFKVVLHAPGERVRALCAHAAEEHGGNGTKSNTYDIFCCEFCLKCFRHVGPRPHVCLPPDKGRPCPICFTGCGTYDRLKSHITAKHCSINAGRELLGILLAASRARYLRPEITIHRCDQCLQIIHNDRHLCPVPREVHICPVCNEELPGLEALVSHCDERHRLGTSVARIAAVLAAQYYVFPRLRGACPYCLEAKHYGKCKHPDEPRRCRKCYTYHNDLAAHMLEHSDLDSDSDLEQEEVEEQETLVQYRARIAVTVEEKPKPQEIVAPEQRTVVSEPAAPAAAVLPAVARSSAPVAAKPRPKPGKKVCELCLVDAKYHGFECASAGREVPCVVCGVSVDPANMIAHISEHAGSKVGLHSVAIPYLYSLGHTVAKLSQKR